jgi:hypothetical protein
LMSTRSAAVRSRCCSSCLLLLLGHRFRAPQL